MILLVSATFYQSGKVKKLQTLPELIKRQVFNAVERGTRLVRNEIHAEYVSRGIGRALFTGRGTRILGGSALATIIKKGRSRWLGDVLESSVYAKGTAALVARGGKTVAHVIKPSLDTFRTGGVFSVAKTQRYMKDFYGGHRAGETGAYDRLKRILSNGPGKGFLSGGPVNHPGSRFKKDDFLSRGAARALPRFRVEVAKGMDKVAEIVNRG